MEGRIFHNKEKERTNIFNRELRKKNNEDWRTYMFIKEREQEKKRECKEGQICVEKRTRQN